MNRKNNTRWSSTKRVQHTESCYVTLMHCGIRKKWLTQVKCQKCFTIEKFRSPSKLHRNNRHQ